MLFSPIMKDLCHFVGGHLVVLSLGIFQHQRFRMIFFTILYYLNIARIMLIVVAFSGVYLFTIRDVSR